MAAARRGPLRVSPCSILSAFNYTKRPLISFSKATFSLNRRAMGTIPDTDLFTYTSGRFLYNEQRRLEERQVSFNVTALQCAAEQYIGHGKITNLQKFAEGGFNRIFLLTTEDGSQAIAKIPYKISVPKYYTTASEVATTKFLQSKGIPVPRILGWSSDADNAVGVEYIIMEKATGIPLETRWFNLSKEERHYLVTSLVDIEKQLFDIPFGHYGSIYFRKDVPLELQQNLYSNGTDAAISSADDQFCIGPTTDYMFWYGKRGKMGIDRGPWRTPKDYLVSIGNRESEWAKRYGGPRPVRFPHVVNFPGIKDPAEYMQLLDQYMTVASGLLGGDTQSELNRPTLRHPDLTPGNIFLCPETHKISCIIDWQNTTLLPLLLTAGHPPFLQSPDDPPPPILQKPALPDDYDSLGPEEKSQVDELYRRQSLFYIYTAFNGGLNKRHLSGMRDPRVLLTQHLVERAEKQWSGDVFSLKGALIRVIENWHRFNEALPKPVPCPISFSKSEVEAYYEQEPNWFEANFLIEYWKSELGGLNDDGWVRTEMYEDTVKKSLELKQVLLDGCDTPEEERLVQEQWPFQDHEEDMN